ncbi:hypothetical protein [Amycolatopsis minnesotensis]
MNERQDALVPADVVLTYPGRWWQEAAGHWRSSTADSRLCSSGKCR